MPEWFRGRILFATVFIAATALAVIAFSGTLWAGWQWDTYHVFWDCLLGCTFGIISMIGALVDIVLLLCLVAAGGFAD